jgi:hypothetical protein
MSKALQFWNNFNKTAKLVLIVLGGFLAMSLYHSFTSESKLDTWRTDFKEFREEAAVTIQLADSLQQLADVAVAVADSATERADSLVGEVRGRDLLISDLRDRTKEIEVANDSTFATLTQGRDEETVVREEHPVAVPWIRLTFSLRKENSLLSKQIDVFRVQRTSFEELDATRLTTIMAWETGFNLQRARADSLQQIVINIPDAPPTEKLFGIIPLPSRQTSFIVGAVVGVVLYTVANNALAGGN